MDWPKRVFLKMFLTFVSDSGVCYNQYVTSAGRLSLLIDLES